jgi:hypothetical protein
VPAPVVAAVGLANLHDAAAIFAQIDADGSGRLSPAPS